MILTCGCALEHHTLGWWWMACLSSPKFANVPRHVCDEVGVNIAEVAA